MPPLGPDRLDFTSTARDILKYLHARNGLALWMVTRVDGDDWIVIEAEDHGYRLEAPAVFRWSDSFCSRMVLGRGPRVAPASALVPAYAEAPIGKALNIQSYVGIPLTRADGALFGTLCAIDPAPQPESLQANLPLFELFAKILSTMLAAEIELGQLFRKAERANAEADTDCMTGLYNRRAWDRFVAAEEDRCRTYGHPACVIAVDLDGLKQANDTEGHSAGDRLIVNAANLLRKAVRKSDFVARVGGDEFFVLSPECDADCAATITERVRSSFEEARIRASVGMARRVPPRDLIATIAEADRKMYAEKQSRKPIAVLSGAFSISKNLGSTRVQ